MALEQELKLVVNSGVALELSSLILPNYSIDRDIETMHLVSTYFDTNDLYLVSHGVGLRMRQSDKVWMQTVKTSGHVQDGLHQREEWEHQLDGPEWNIEKLKQTPLSLMIDDPNIWGNIAPVFTTDFVRKTLQLVVSDGTHIELAYDQGQIIAGDLALAIHEIELELKSGDVTHLSLLASQLQDQLPLSPNDISKAKMGYQLISKHRSTSA